MNPQTPAGKPVAALIFTCTLIAGGLCPAADETESGDTVQMNLRMEFYDVPAAEALRIQQEVSIQRDQTAARDRILEMVEAGQAAFVTSATVITRAGARAKYEDAERVPVIVDFTWNKEAQQLVPVFDEREVGTIFEVDPSIASDGKAWNINFAIEHHTGDPENATVKVPMGGTGESKDLSITRFHQKKTTMKIYLEPGTCALVGAYEITGQVDGGPPSTIENAKRLAILCADEQKMKSE